MSSPYADYVLENVTVQLKEANMWLARISLCLHILTGMAVGYLIGKVIGAVILL